ncbi:carboxymuconolactone decarboxylase family protein [Petrachloros mirabilis]
MTTAAATQKVDAIFSAVEQAYGWVPNLIKEMSISVPTAQAYLSGQQALAKGSLSPKEQQAVQLTVVSVNGCHYCQEAHAWIGGKVRISAEDIAAIRSGQFPEDETLAPIVEITRLIMKKRGWLSEEELRQAESKGISKTRLYEIITYIGLKTISNYINHIAHTPVDSQFRA